MHPFSKSCFSIPVYRLEPEVLVKPILEIDVLFLKNEFVGGYWQVDQVLYVWVVDNLGMNSM